MRLLLLANDEAMVFLNPLTLDNVTYRRVDEIRKNMDHFLHIQNGTILLNHLFDIHERGGPDVGHSWENFGNSSTWGGTSINPLSPEQVYVSFYIAVDIYQSLIICQSLNFDICNIWSYIKVWSYVKVWILTYATFDHMSKFDFWHRFIKNAPIMDVHKLIQFFFWSHLYIYILLYVTLSVKVLKKSMVSSLAGSNRRMMVWSSPKLF
jgi:hypothetical protein